MELQGTLQADLQPDVVAVHLNCPRTDMQFFPAVLAGLTLGHEDHDLEFPVSEIMKVMIVTLHCFSVPDQ